MASDSKDDNARVANQTASHQAAYDQAMAHPAITNPKWSVTNGQIRDSGGTKVSPQDVAHSAARDASQARENMGAVGIAPQAVRDANILLQSSAEAARDAILKANRQNKNKR